MIGKIIKVLIVAVVLAVVIQSLPDLKRYLKLRDMLAVKNTARPRFSPRRDQNQ